MKKLITIAALLLLASSAHAALLTGQTPSSYAIPSGWSLFLTQNFEGALSANENMDMSFATDRYHSGARSIKDSFAGDAASVAYWVRSGKIGSFSEVYISWYQYTESQARFNDEYWIAQFEKRGPAGELYQEIIVDWMWVPTWNSTESYLYFVPQSAAGGGRTWRTGGARKTVPVGAWYQWELHYRPNTSGQTNGFMRIYKDGVLWEDVDNANLNGAVDMTNMSIKIGGVYTKLTWLLSGGACATTFGGGTDSGPRVTNFNNCYCDVQCPPSGTVPIYYHYIDDVIVMKLTGASGGTDVQPPYTTNLVPASGATGVPVTNQTISFNIRDDRTDDSGITQNTIAMTVEGSGVVETITGSTSNYAVSYTSPDPWTNGQVVNVTATATDVAGNVMNQSWSFTAAAAPATLTVSTASVPGGTVGTAYTSTTLAATGGTTPYTWSVSSGSLPAGLVLSSAGVITGTPTTAGTFAFTVLATDAEAGTDDQTLSIVVAPSQVVSEIGITFSDTWINSGAASTNYSDNLGLRVYQWPEYTATNKTLIFDNVDIQAIPDNVMVTNAKLRLWLYDYDGSGGSNPMRVYAYNVTGTLPTMETVTWDTFAGTTTLLSYTDVGLDNAYYDFDVTNAVQSAYTAREPVYLLLSGGAEGVADSNRIFASYEYATEEYRPQLIVTYEELGGEPPAPKIGAPGRLRVSSLKGKVN